MQSQVHPTRIHIGTRAVETGDIELTCRPLYDVVGHAVSNPRKAISDKNTGAYAVYSPSGFEGVDGLPKAECILIHKSGVVEIIPHDYDKQKIIHSCSSTVDGLDFVFESYPRIMGLESVTIDSAD